MINIFLLLVTSDSTQSFDSVEWINDNFAFGKRVRCVSIYVILFFNLQSSKVLTISSKPNVTWDDCEDNEQIPTHHVVIIYQKVMLKCCGKYAANL